MLFSSYINKLAWAIRRVHASLTWGEALRTAIDLASSGLDISLDAPTALFGEWTPQTQRALAGHFWALKLLYREVGDEGRSLAFGRISSSLFASWEEGGRVNFYNAARQRGWGSAVMNEIVAFYRAAGQTHITQRSTHTPRVASLLQSLNQQPNRVHYPTWTF